MVELCGRNWYGNQRVGVLAPPDVAVFREEVRHLYGRTGGERAEGKQVPEAAQEEAAPPANNGTEEGES